MIFEFVKFFLYLTFAKEIPLTWSDEPEAITAFKNFCAPYTFMKFRPTMERMYAGVEKKVQNCTGPPKRGIKN